MFLAAVIVTAVLLAKVEIHIEGSAGWAEKLPTWRLKNRWTRLLLGNRPLTGFHLYLQLYILATAHIPFLLCLAPLSWQGECRVLSYVILLWATEDFLWFVLNPAFGIRNFRRERIWWHSATWWWIMPREYWVFVPLAITLYIISI